MKRLTASILVLCVVFLNGCSHQKTIDVGLVLRREILAAESCIFVANITADYIDRVHTFKMQCKFDKSGNMAFAVIDPELIAGITGSIAADGGKLTFDDQLLAFELLADDQLSPVSAPWVFMKALRSGYIHSVAGNHGYLQLRIDDSYEDNAMEVDIRLNPERQPVYAEILWKNCKILSLSISDFCIL